MSKGFSDDRNNSTAAAQAAAIVGTNRQYMADAKRISEQAPDLALAVKSGEMKMPEARRQLKDRMPEPEPAPLSMPNQEPLTHFPNPGSAGNTVLRAGIEQLGRSKLFDILQPMYEYQRLQELAHATEAQFAGRNHVKPLAGAYSG